MLEKPRENPRKGSDVPVKKGILRSETSLKKKAIKSEDKH